MASSSNSTIHQFRIELIDIMPSIWRVIQVPSTFDMFDLHCAVNDAMGWQDYHYHVFKALNLNTKRADFVGQPLENSKKAPIDGRSAKITDYFKKAGDWAEYWYDFGDRWEHRVMLHKIILADATKSYPICIGGKRACPPEDCGGTDGYDGLLLVMKNKQDPQYARMMNWLNEAHKIVNFDPERFDPTDIQFRPKESREYPYRNKAEESFYDYITML